MIKLSDFIVKIEPKPLQRHRHFTRGKFSGSYDPSKSDKNKLCLLSAQYAPNKPFDCPLMVNYTFGFKRPKNHYRTGKNSHLLKKSVPTYHTQKPDKSNLEKLVEDAFNKLFWKDDSLIVCGNSQKIWTELESFIKIEIFKLHELKERGL
jgi:Holliday junction resolvase RusA-like endonuclease